MVTNYEKREIVLQLNKKISKIGFYLHKFELDENKTSSNQSFINLKNCIFVLFSEYDKKINQLSYFMEKFLHNLINDIPIGRCQEMFFKSTLCCQIFKFEKLRIAIYLPGRFFPLHFYASVSIQAMHHLSK